MSDIDTFISAPPRTRFAFAIKARVGPIQDLGQTALITKPYDYELLTTRIRSMVTPRSGG